METTQVRSVEDRVRTILKEHLGIEWEEIKPDSRLVEDLGTDSLDTIELLYFIEEAFDLAPDEGQRLEDILLAGEVKTFKQLVKAVERVSGKRS